MQRRSLGDDLRVEQQHPVPPPTPGISEGNGKINGFGGEGATHGCFPPTSLLAAYTSPSQTRATTSCASVERIISGEQRAEVGDDNDKGVLSDESSSVPSQPREALHRTHLTGGVREIPWRHYRCFRWRQIARANQMVATMTC